MEWSQLPVLVTIAQAAPINANTAISVALVVVIVGATWKISAVLTKICVQLEPLTKLPDEVSKLKAKVGQAVDHIQGLEDDVNTLWGTVRGESLDTMRKKPRNQWSDIDDSETK